VFVLQNIVIKLACPAVWGYCMVSSAVLKLPHTWQTTVYVSFLY